MNYIFVLAGNPSANIVLLNTLVASGIRLTYRKIDYLFARFNPFKLGEWSTRIVNRFIELLSKEMNPDLASCCPETIRQQSVLLFALFICLPLKYILCIWWTVKLLKTGDFNRPTARRKTSAAAIYYGGSMSMIADQSRTMACKEIKWNSCFLINSPESHIVGG